MQLSAKLRNSYSPTTAFKTVILPPLTLSASFLNHSKNTFHNVRVSKLASQFVLSKLQYIYTVEYLSAVHSNEFILNIRV